MPIGLTARQKAELSAMLPHIEESITALKRVIADTKDRTRALQRLSEAEEAQKRHARDVGIPFNADAFAARRAELESLPKTLTVEDGQLAAFTSLQRAIGVVLEGPYTRESRGGGRAGARGSAKGAKAGARSTSSGGKGAAKRAGKGSASGAAKSAAKNAAKGAGKSGARSATRGAAKRGETRTAAPANTSAPVRRIKPLPLALGS